MDENDLLYECGHMDGGGSLGSGYHREISDDEWWERIERREKLDRLEREEHERKINEFWEHRKQEERENPDIFGWHDSSFFDD